MSVPENVINTQKDSSANLVVKKDPKFNIDDLTQSSLHSINTTNVSEFETFMNRMNVPFGTKDFTHQNFFGTGAGSLIYKIADEDYETFLNLYTNYMINDKKIGTTNIMEKPRDIGCLCLDFDLKQTTEGRLFTEPIVTKIIRIANEIITTTFKPKKLEQDEDDDESDSDEDSDDDDENTFGEILQSYVLVKNEPYADERKGVIVDGFHIQYPNLILSYADRYYVFDRLKTAIETCGLFNSIYPSLEEGAKVCDESVILKNCWFMYGSGKTLNNKVHYYRIQWVFDEDGDSITPLKASIASNKVLISKLAIRKPLHRTVEYIDKASMLPKLEEIKRKFCADRSSANNIAQTFFKPPSMIGRTLIKPLEKNAKKMNTDDDTEQQEDEEFECKDKEYLKHIKAEEKLATKSAFYDEKRPVEDINIELARKYVKLLNPERSIPYHQWIFVGWALYGVSPKLFPEFVEFSKQCPKKFSNQACQKVWKECQAKKPKMGIHALRSWASQDNHDGFMQVLNEQVADYFDQCDCKTHFGMAMLLYIIYGNVFKCSSLKNHSWWHFDGVRWMSNEKAQKLKKIMSMELCAELEKIRVIYKTKANAEKGTAADIFNKKGDSVRDIIIKLQDHPFKEKVIAECENLFYHFEFEKVLDNNRYLMGFDNGVYDLKLKTFRKAIPEDYVSATTGYDYEDLSMDDENVIGVDGFMRGIQPEADMNLYVWIYCSSFVEGGNKDQKFIIFTGSGSNGKSILTILLKQALGDYYGTVPIELITKERGSASSANPEMEDKKVVRTLTMEEPERGAKIYTSYIKLITGGTPIMARGLYKNPIYFVPQFKLLISCNDKPTIEADDGGTWRRMIVINFGMKFVKEPKLPNERLKDKSLEEKSKSWGPAFMWLLLNKYYPMYAEHDLDYYEPENVRLATQQYKQDSNVFIEYFNSGEVIRDEKAKISIKTLHTYFKAWHEQLYSEKKVPMLKKFIEYCNKENIPIDGQQMLLGYKLKVQMVTQSSEFDA